MQGDTKGVAPLNSSQIALLSARLYRQIFCPQRLIVQYVLSAAVKDNLACVKDYGAVGQFKGTHGVLFNNNCGHTLLLDKTQGFFDLVDNNRGEPLIWLVQQQDLDLARQCAGDRQHLLFAARQGDALLFAAFLKAGKQIVNP